MEIAASTTEECPRCCNGTGYASPSMSRLPCFELLISESLVLCGCLEIARKTKIRWVLVLSLIHSELTESLSLFH